MKTDNLINMLAQSAQEADVPPSKTSQMWVWLGACAVTLFLTVALYKLNPDLLQTATSGWFWLRFAFLASIGGLAWVSLTQLGNPARARSARLAWLALPSAVMAVVASVMLMEAPSSERLAMLLGTTWKVCSISIAFLAVPLFVSAVFIVRGFAPTRLRTTGAVLGLLSGAVAALIYTLHCPELHPAFLVFWYGLGVLIPAGVGWLLGERLLKW
jgi:hypothetical protein